MAYQGMAMKKGPDGRLIPANAPDPVSRPPMIQPSAPSGGGGGGGGDWVFNSMPIAPIAKGGSAATPAGANPNTTIGPEAMAAIQANPIARMLNQRR